MHRFGDIRLQKCRDLEHPVRGRLRSLEMSPSDRAHMNSHWRSTISTARSTVVYELFNVENCCDIQIRGQRSLHVIDSCTIRKIVHYFLLVFFIDFVPKTKRFPYIWLLSIQWPWNPGYGSLKLITNYNTRSGTHDFLLTSHSTTLGMSHRFLDKRRYLSTITRYSPIFTPPVYLTLPLKGVLRGILYRRMDLKK